MAQTDGTWPALLDVADAVFSIPLAPENQEQLPFTFQGLHYAFAVFLQEDIDFLPLACGGWVRI